MFFFYFYHNGISVQVKGESILSTLLIHILGKRVEEENGGCWWRESRGDEDPPEQTWLWETPLERKDGKGKGRTFSPHPKSFLKIIAAPLGWAGTEESKIITSNEILFVGTRNRKQTKCRSSTYVDWDLVNVLGVVWNVFLSHFVRVYPSNQQ